jgi:hypothetical protein
VSDVRYTCDHCDRAEDRPKVSDKLGGADASARVAGWRIGATQTKPRNVICPECAGTDEDYWDRITLSIAHMAGIDAGNPQILPGTPAALPPEVFQ